MERYFAIGDIHGQYERLVDVLEQIKYGEGGRIVFLGDYVDRGKKSREVLATVKELVEADKAWAILGNHDDMMVKVFDRPKEIDNLWWKQHYLKPTRNSYYTMKGYDHGLYKEHVEFLRGLPKVYQTKSLHFSHSGHAGDWLWGRPILDQAIHGKYNIHGHTPIDEPFFGKNRCNLDTGCAWKDGKLTCAVFVEYDRIPEAVYASSG